eukprot:TRINITY_DN20132_c0_g1_i2.p1 TRINITY_DN20132_c0_g1~~TRINITY_DN20132_c0_g1_i2.p1  ORF type:complete len:373 (-),score=18.09 TRINITY_DN20132_c0_g1_i2:66-1184(-)
MAGVASSYTHILQRITQRCRIDKARFSCQSNRRQLLSVTFPLLFVQEVSQEIELWKEEVDYYTRQGRQKAIETFPSLQKLQDKSRSKTLQVDPEFAKQLLDLPLQALTEHDEMRKYLDWNSDKYDHDYYALYSSELPSFSKAGICGHCGRNGNGDLSDPDWIDFLSYVQYKAIAKQLPQKSLGGSPVLTGFEMLHGPTITERLGTAPMGSNEILRSVVGACILTHIISRENDLLQTRSPVLEDIQKGVGVILNQFENLGYCEYARLVQCGISNDQYECNYAWKLGEPAYLKYKLYNPVTLRGSQAMVDEEGFSQDFLAGALQAYLDQCGVKAYRFKRLPSLTDQYSVIEQFTFRRIVDLPRDILPQSKINVL